MAGEEMGGGMGTGPITSPKEKKGEPKKAEKVDKKKAEKISDEAKKERDAANGDMGSGRPEFDEPKGTRHTDQFNTHFPSEVNTVPRG